MQVMIVAGKDIGARCIEYLLDAFPDDEYRFFVSPPGPEPVIDVLTRRDIGYSVATKEALRAIAAEPGVKFDWLLNLWGSVILEPAVIACSSLSLNIHPAYLPYGRGRDPVVWAIRYGDPAGVTLHEITASIDAGPIWYREEIEYSLPITGRELYTKVTSQCSKVFCQQWPIIRDGKLLPEPQIAPPTTPTFRRADLLRDRVIDIDNDAESRAVMRRILAHDFGPNYTALVAIGGKLFEAVLSLKAVEPVVES